MVTHLTQCHITALDTVAFKNKYDTGPFVYIHSSLQVENGMMIQRGFYAMQEVF